VSTDHGTTRPAATQATTATPDDPEQIRREIERTQDALSNDVDALTEKVTPGRIVERRVQRARGTAARWKDKVMGSNPMQSGTARDTAQQVAGSVSGTASSAASSVSDAASGAASTVTGAASGAASTVTGAVSEAPQFARQQAQGNPLAAGLIAFGAGWLISSLLPATRREQELADQAKNKATELGRPVADAAKQAAIEAKENLAEPAQEAVESVRSTATDAGRTVADEGRAAAGNVQGQAQESAGNARQNTS
jgi:hypothetical protein